MGERAGGALKRRGLLAGLAALVGAGGLLQREARANHQAPLTGHSTVAGQGGVTGLSTVDAADATGVFGEASGTTTGVKAVWGRINSTAYNAYAVYGQSEATGYGKGVYGSTQSSWDGAMGVYGAALSFSGRTNGVYGYTSSSHANSAGVEGVGGHIGVRGMPFNAPGFGVKGMTYGGSEGPSPDTAAGVWGTADSAMGVTGTLSRHFGVHGKSTSYAGVGGVSQSGFGVWGKSDGGLGVFGESVSNHGVFGRSTHYVGVYAESGSNSGVFASSPARGVWGRTTAGIGVLAQATSGGSVQNRGYGLYAAAPGPGWAGYFEGNVYVTGQLLIAGRPVGPVTADAAGRATEPAASLVEDVGEARLVAGRAEVALAPAFAAAVQGGAYHVFLTEGGDYGGVFVPRKDPSGFEVRARNVAAAGPVSYRIVAKRSGAPGPRAASAPAEVSPPLRLPEPPTPPTAPEPPTPPETPKPDANERPEPPGRPERR